ncbi:hypothetical protein T06_3090 [Trichinella sp. T6]|nr:hypothetical protein T06_3090 [Trichinella sp. T6]
MEQRPVGFQCKKNGSSITDKALQRIKTCNNGMHNAESRSVRLHECLQFYLNDTIMQREQENEAVEMAQSICREALQVTQMWIEIDGSISSDSTVIKTKCKRELSKLSSKVLSNAEYVRQIKEEKRRSEDLPVTPRISMLGKYPVL